MKKSLVLFAMAVVLIVSFSGCGKKESVSEMDAVNNDVVSKDEVKDIADFMESQQEIAENYDPNDPEATAKMMENYMELGANMELQEFDKAEAVDAPSGFPASLIYNKGKITSASDSGDETYVNQNITIQTKDDVKTVKDFYKNLFAGGEWKVTSQSSEGGGASYSLTAANGLEAGVDITSDSYSKLVSISVWYSGSTVTE